MDTSITLPQRFKKVAMQCAFSDSKEWGAWVECSINNIECDPWTQKPRLELLVQNVVPLTEDDVVSASENHLTVKTARFVKMLGIASSKGRVLGFLHGHPSGQQSFSEHDDENERNLWQAATNRQGSSALLASLLMLPDGSISSRTWYSRETPLMARLRVNGAACELHGAMPLSGEQEQRLDRQSRVFGYNSNTILANLKIAVVGAGGTGSATLMMLARAGVIQLASIDPDIFESSNLHRNHLASATHVGQYKAVVAAKEVNRLGLGTQCISMTNSISDNACQDLLKASDVILCATDDHAGRIYLNRFAYCYETLVIDMGLGICLSSDGVVQDMTARVTSLYPGASCLLCRNVVNPLRAREEHLHRTNPLAYSELEQEGYVFGQGDPEPAFIAMTTSTACMAIEELLQCISGFRGEAMSTQQRLRRFTHLDDRRCGPQANKDCPICSSNELWARGDMTPFLDCVA